MGVARAQTPTRAEHLVREVETLLGELAEPTLEVPLPVIDRLEHALQAAHRTNLLRIDALEQRASHNLGIPPRLTAHQIDTLRLYEQLGTYAGVADFRGVNVSAVDDTLRLIRVKLGVSSTQEAVAWLREQGTAT